MSSTRYLRCGRDGATGEAQDEPCDIDWHVVQWSRLQDFYFSEVESDSDEEDDGPRRSFEGQQLLVRSHWDCHNGARRPAGPAHPDDLWRRLLAAAPGCRLNTSVDQRRLAELEHAWRRITPQEFVMTLGALGPSETQCEYLSCLALPVDPELLERKTPRKYARGHSLIISGVTDPWSSSGENRFPKFYVQKAFCPGRQNEYTYRFAYTTALRILDTSDTLGQAHVVKALLDHGGAGHGRSGFGVHGTLMGRAILVNAWLSARHGFYRHRWVDAVHLLFLSAVGLKLRAGFGPDHLTVFVLAILSLRGVYELLFELVKMSRHFGKPFVFKTSAALCFLEYFSAIAVWGVLYSGRNHINKPCLPGVCPIYDHMALFSVSILCKWAHFISSMLCIRTIGTMVLPAYYTIISPESIRFLSVLFVCVLGAFNAYYALPIEDTNALPFEHPEDVGNQSAVWLALQSLSHAPAGIPNNVLMMWLRMFKLISVGDFDSWDLEGKDPIVSLNLTALRAGGTEPSTVGVIDDPDPDPHFHQSVILLGVVLATVINVILMNVYIGLLSSVYGTNAARHWELLAEFRAVHAIRHLLACSPLHACAQAGCALCAKRRCCKRHLPQFCARESDRRDHERGALWIAYRNDEFEAGYNNQETAFVEIKEILREVRELRGKLPGAALPEARFPDFFS